MALFHVLAGPVLIVRLEAAIDAGLLGAILFPLLFFFVLRPRARQIGEREQAEADLRAERRHGALGVIMLDLYHFKNFNDGYGHEADDHVLREVGALLNLRIRSGDIACRYGGEEFALILPEMPVARFSNELKRCALPSGNSTSAIGGNRSETSRCRRGSRCFRCTAIAASEEYVNWKCIEYDAVVAALRSNPFMNAGQVAVAVDGRLGGLLTATDQFTLALTNGLAANRKKYDRAFGATRTMWQAPMDKDLYDLSNEINLAVSDAGIKTKAQAVMNAVSSVVLWEGHANAYSDVHGMTIYHISKASQKDSNYAYYRSTLDFALTTSWDEFLNAYAQ